MAKEQMQIIPTRAMSIQAIVSGFYNTVVISVISGATRTRYSHI